jgi:hypothetical protein
MRGSADLLFLPGVKALQKANKTLLNLQKEIYLSVQ